MTPPVNQKTFNLVNRVSKSFDLLINNFAYAATLLFRIAFKIGMAFSPTFALKFVTTINLRRIRIIVSQTKLITSITQTINARRVRLIYTMRERLKAVSTISLRLRMTPVSKAIQKAVSSIIIRKIVLTIDPILAQFFILGDYDPQTLGDLDALTLGEMDYTTS
jgi:hypothetical protein